MKKLLSACLLATILISSLPWEAAALPLVDASSTIEAASGAMDPAEADSDSGTAPVGDCACLCGLCSASVHASPIAVPNVSVRASDPGVAVALAPPTLHPSTRLTRLFRPPRLG